MRDISVVHGMVLFQAPFGENDKRFIILTKEYGKITAFARGAKRPGNALLAVGPFSTGEFELYDGKSAYTLVKATISNYFRELSMDPLDAYYGFYFLELAEYYGMENADETELINLLYITLRALERRLMPKALLRRVFELKLLGIEGEYPNVFQCTVCGGKEDLKLFSFKRRGLVCEDCSAGENADILSASTIYTMRYVITADIKEVYAFKINDDTKDEFIRVVDKYISMYIGHDFKSLEVLESMEMK